MSRHRPGGTGRMSGGGIRSAVIIPYPPSRRIRVTPLQTRLSAFESIEAELRAAQADEQRAGLFTARLSRCIEWLDIVAEWEQPHYEATA